MYLLSPSLVVASLDNRPDQPAQDTVSKQIPSVSIQIRTVWIDLIEDEKGQEYGR
jgi:hypothetical protein